MHFDFSAFLEAAGALDEAASVFDAMLERDLVSAENKQLALIQVRVVGCVCVCVCVCVCLCVCEQRSVV